MKKTNTGKLMLSFAAIDKALETHKVENITKEIRGRDYLLWGKDNRYPFYLYDLYKNVPTLHSIIETAVDYICGDEIIGKWVYATEEEISDLIYDIAKSYMIFGGFALSVSRNKRGEVAQISCLDFRNVRSNKDGSKYYYSTDFNKSAYIQQDVKCYPAFTPDNNALVSIYYYKDDKYSVYPTPIYGAAITACEIEKSIDEYHLNSINNNFMGSVMVSLNNGVPDDNIKAEIEKNFNEKFTGKENAGRVVISYNEDKEHAATIEKIETEDFSDRYNSLAERSQQAIFTAFRCTPALVGIPSKNNGFAAEEYQSEYVLFYRTMIAPIQKMIISHITRVMQNSEIEIKPFTIQFPEGTVKDKNIEE